MITFKMIDRQTGEAQEAKLTLDAVVQGRGLIGRHPNCDIVLSSPEVSRVHGRIVYQAGQYFYTDLGSTGGSRINNEPVQTNQHLLLSLGDIIRIGRFSLLVQTLELNGDRAPIAPTMLSIPEGYSPSSNSAQAVLSSKVEVESPPQAQPLVLKAVDCIFPAETLKAKGLLKQGPAELVFQGKALVEGLSLSKRLQERAIALCQAELDLGRLCIVVEHVNHLTLWQEK